MDQDKKINNEEVNKIAGGGKVASGTWSTKPFYDQAKAYARSKVSYCGCEHAYKKFVSKTEQYCDYYMGTGVLCEVVKCAECGALTYWPKTMTNKYATIDMFHLGVFEEAPEFKY